MVTILAVIINHNVWIKYTKSFSVWILITNLIKVYLMSVFQHGSSNIVQDSSQKLFFSNNKDLDSGPFIKNFT